MKFPGVWDSESAWVGRTSCTGTEDEALTRQTGFAFCTPKARSPLPAFTARMCSLSCALLQPQTPKAQGLLIGIVPSPSKQVKLIPARHGGDLKGCVFLKCVRGSEGAIRRRLAVEKIFCNSRFLGRGGMEATHQGHGGMLQGQKGDGGDGNVGEEPLLWLPQKEWTKR